jgi:hypothetical protein
VLIYVRLVVGCVNELRGVVVVVQNVRRHTLVLYGRNEARGLLGK